MIRVTLDLPWNFSEGDLFSALEDHIPVSRGEIEAYRFLSREMKITDAAITEKTTVALLLSPEREAGLLKMRKKVSTVPGDTLEIPQSSLVCRPVVVGFGPAGLFAALTLAEAGARPIVLERGSDVVTRAEAVRKFHLTRIPDPSSNIQFGEGGAGAFSDGKLKCGARDAVKMKILRTFVEAGAEEEILWQAAPHLGTDRLPGIVKNIREKILSLGGEVVFGARVTDLVQRQGKVVGVRYEKDGRSDTVETDAVFIAAGHSAHDTFEMLLRAGLILEPRPFGIGMRVEHERQTIDRVLYGKHDKTDLPAASYHLVTHLPNGRSVYSFCMCPGGEVVAASSEADGVVTNGMSPHARDLPRSNAALLVSVTPDDFPSRDPLAGVAFQRAIEQKAFSVAGGDYTAPAIPLSDFLAGARPGAFSLAPSYPLGTAPVSPEEYLPKFIPDAVREAFCDFDARLPGFASSPAALTGPETRSTSPVRVLRGENFEATGAPGVYPVGEGAGYGGGIVSSAADGIRAALALLNKK